MSWESSEYVGESEPNFIPQECVDRFTDSLALPTKPELQAGRKFLDHDVRPKLDVYTSEHPCPPFAGERELRDYQLQGLNWLNVSFFKGLSSILADEMGSARQQSGSKGSSQSRNRAGRTKSEREAQSACVCVSVFLLVHLNSLDSERR